MYNVVPVISRIIEKITEDLRSYNSDDHIITVQEIKDARERLKKDKYDGGAGLWSNHVLYSPDVFNVHLYMLATAMTVHGYNAEDLLIGTMISLPKSRKANICDSNNYRGICLCYCINKLLEWCMIHRYGDKLYTSNLQFSFQSGHSTSM